MQIKSVTITTGEIGMRHQALGLAACLSEDFQEHVVRLPSWLRHLPSNWIPTRLLSLPEIEDANILISCGRRSVAYSLALKQNKPELFTVHIQNPQVSLSHFDLVVPMDHDNCHGPNVLSTQTAIHHLFHEDLAGASKPFTEQLQGLPQKKIVFVLGGNTKDYRFTQDKLNELLQAMAYFKQIGYAVMVSTARRTPNEIADRLKQETDHYDWAYLGDGANPYLCLLNEASGFVMTSDSVSMVSEALFTGKPLYLVDLEGFNKRLTSFKKTLIEAGYARQWCGEFMDYSYRAPDAKVEVAKMIRNKLERTQ